MTDLFAWLKKNLTAKNIALLVLVVIILSAINNGNALYTRYIHSKYKGTAQAMIVSFIPEEERVQSFRGDKTIIAGYHLELSYKVDTMEFNVHDYIQATPKLSALFEEYSKGKPLTIEIRYLPDSPESFFVSGQN
ncbi:MAG: hypothetical protein H6538_01805 [Bacteroidales bacterium]|nr:hypothetical protein [Bacteroidales bacterium]MCB9013133.1 hypothetical protein [Bacteroidales bacterium]